jgi:hypothetical protein
MSDDDQMAAHLKRAAKIYRLAHPIISGAPGVGDTTT